MNPDENNLSDSIVAFFAEHFGLPEKAIISPNRKKEVVRARDLIAYLLREYAGMSFPAIGRILGGRDHSTIIHAYRKVKKRFAASGMKPEIEPLIARAKDLGSRREQISEIIESYQSKILPELLAGIRSGGTQSSQIKARAISPRDLEILDLYRQGLTLENIGRLMKLTRERARQIAERAIRQSAINDSIARGIVIDGDTVLEEEKKKRRAVKKAQSPKPVMQKKEKRWSRYYAECRVCHTTSIPHVRNGLCQRHAGQFRGTLREEIVMRHSGACDKCGISRGDAIRNYGRDLYIMKDEAVLCRRCFLLMSGQKLGATTKRRVARPQL